VPYHELPPEQKVKDHLFVAVVTALAGGLPDGATRVPPEQLPSD
jgi:hypothetical protein